MKTLFLDSVAGIAGDMFAASFVDAGLVPAEELVAIPALLGLPDVTVEISRPVRASILTTHIDVTCKGGAWKALFDHPHDRAHHHGADARHHGHDPDPHWHTHYADIDRFLERAPLDGAVTSFARRVFRLLAEAEADAHGTDLHSVTFHELGAIDSIIDVVMAASCVTHVGARVAYATPVKLGRGLVHCEHGTFAVPAPASARLAVGLEVDGVPAPIVRDNLELSTPTGLAILRALAPTFVRGMPAGTLLAQGMGAGTMDLGLYPNVFRVMLIDAGAPGLAATEPLPYETDKVVELVCNLDDDTAERTAWVAQRLLAHGSLEVWTLPGMGKKGRITVELHALSRPEDWRAHADWLLRNSSTFGLRHREWDRLKLARRFETRGTPLGEVTYKIGLTTSGEIVKEKAEFEDMRKHWDREAAA